MNGTRYMTLCVALCFFIGVVSCGEDGATTESELEITFEKASYLQHTKAVQITDLSSFSVSAIKAGSLLWSEDAVWSDGIYSTGRFWAERDNGAAFYAANSEIHYDGGTPYVLYDRNEEDIDLLAATALTPVFRGSNTLTFHHLLARIGMLSVIEDNGFSVTGLTASIRAPYVSGRWSYDGTWSNLVAGGDEAIEEGANNIWLIPGTYEISVSYILSDGEWSTSCTGTGEVTLAAGDLNRINLTVGDEIAFNIDAEVLPWNYREDSYNYSTEITIGSEGRLAWQSGTYASLSSETHRVISAFNTDFEADFLIETPEGSTWYAILETQSGALDAFRFVDDGGNLSASAHGVVGEEGHIRIRQTNLYPSVTNSATLLFVVRSGGRNIPVTGLVDNLGSNWTIIQNANN